MGPNYSGFINGCISSLRSEKGRYAVANLYAAIDYNLGSLIKAIEEDCVSWDRFHFIN